MGKLVADDLTGRTCRKIPRLFDPSARLRSNAGGQFLPITDHFDGRHTPSCDSTSGERQRSVLEALIANVAPRDAASISAALINEFSSLGRVFAETTEAIERVIGAKSDIPDLLHAAHQACVTSLACQSHVRAIHSTDQTLINYLVASMGSKTFEQLRVLFLDRSNHVVGDEVMASGSVSTMTVYPRTIFKRALELSASSVLLVHNHPGGNIEPSQSDIAFTSGIAAAAQMLEIKVYDHIIIAGTRWFSFTRRGLL